MKKINFPSHKSDWNEFEKNDKTISRNELVVPYKIEQIRLAYVSKHNLNRENQVILLMITNNRKWHYISIKGLSALLRGIPSDYNADFYCLNCFHSFRTKNVLKKHENVCKDHDYCFVGMPNKDSNISKYNHGKNFMKTPFIRYAGIKSLLEKNSTCHNNPNES